MLSLELTEEKRWYPNHALEVDYRNAVSSIAWSSTGRYLTVATGHPFSVWQVDVDFGQGRFDMVVKWEIAPGPVGILTASTLGEQIAAVSAFSGTVSVLRTEARDKTTWQVGEQLDLI